MKIIYITNARLPTEWAHGLQIMKTCEALVNAGVALEVWTPARAVHLAQSPFSYYRILSTFPIRRLFTIDVALWGKAGFLIQAFSFAAAARIKLFFEKKPDIIYCRDEAVAALLIFFGTKHVVWESHDGVWNLWARYAARTGQALVVVSNGLKESYTEKGVSKEKIFVIPNGIDLDGFAHPESREASRMRLGLPLDKKVALYVGMLNGWKGTDTLLASVAHLPADTLLAVIGGEGAPLVERLAKQYPSVRFLGYRPQGELPDNLASADVLVLSNTAKNTIAARFTSPLKLFAYMASKKPIVLPDLPSMRELVDEESAYLVPPDSPEALARGIETALADPEGAKKRADAAYERVKEYTWEARAHKITHLIMAESRI
jgi:glycosyltransferase involved in cell wall biosynthesis